MIDPPRPPPDADRGSVDGGEDSRRALRQIGKCRKSTWKRLLAGFTSEGYRVGESRLDCRISDEMVCWLREQHEEHGKGWRKLSRITGLPVGTVKKILAYTRRGSTAAAWKRVDDGE